MKACTVGGDHRRGAPRNGQPALPVGRPWAIEGNPSAEETTAERPSEDEGRMERVGERDNLLRALTHVHSKGGSAGIAGRTVEELAPDRRAHGPRWTQALWAGTSPPPPVQRGEVPKPPGGIRPLGVPPVVDRVIQQAVMPVLQAQGAPPCSDASFGFRLGRNAPHAVQRAQSDLKEGDPWVGDMALEQVFDRVHHAKLRREVATRVQDRRVGTLIHRFLKAGAREHEARHATVDGGPQGGPRSPRRSTLILARLDRELERRGPRVVRIRG